MSEQARQIDKTGYLVGIAAYVIWGMFPLYFIWLAQADAVEIVFYRALWGLAAVIVFLACTHKMGNLRSTLHNRRAVGTLIIAGFLVCANWTIYVYAVNSGRTVDAALGYFINPIMTVALGIVVLREKVSKLQAAAIFCGIASIVVMVVGMGYLPWIAIALPLCFAFYSLAKKQVAASTPPVAGMVIETAAIVPPLAVYEFYLTSQGKDVVSKILSGGGGTREIVIMMALLAGSGIVTIVPQNHVRLGFHQAAAWCAGNDPVLLAGHATDNRGIHFPRAHAAGALVGHCHSVGSTNVFDRRYAGVLAPHEPNPRSRNKRHGPRHPRRERQSSALTCRVERGRKDG